MKTATKLLLMAARAGLTYVFRDDFTGGSASSPRTATPGPGTAVIVDSLATWSVSGSALLPSAQTTGAGDPRYITGAQNRVAARLFQTKVRTLSALGASVSRVMVGWSNSATPSTAGTMQGVRFNGGGMFDLILMAAATLSSPLVCADDTDYVLSFVIQATGAYLFVDGRLLWIFIAGTDVTVYGALTAYGSGRHPIQVGYARVRDLTGRWTTANGIAQVNQTNPPSGTNYAGATNHLTDCVLTAPSPLADSGGMNTRTGGTGQTAWHSYFTSAGAFKVDSVASDGTATNRVNVSSVASAGGTYRMREIAAGNLHDFYTNDGTTWTKRGTQVNLALAGEGVQVNATYTSFTATALLSYPTDASNYAELSQV